MASRLQPLNLDDPPTGAENLAARQIDFGDERPAVVRRNGAISVENPDRSVTITFGDAVPAPVLDAEFSQNLAGSLDESELGRIATEILEGIDADERSRKDWLDAREAGIKLLGLKVEEPRGDSGVSSAPVEGQSSVRHPILLEAVVAFQAGALGELMPATGPVKVRSDMPPGAPVSPPGMPAMAQGDGPADELASALETDLNHYLTVTAREYVPDTDRMFFKIGLGGDGFKKLFHCPLRRRPVSESVDAEDLIVSNAAVDLQACPRVTHRIRMKRSTLRRMQLVGAYRNIELIQPSAPQPDIAEQAKNDITGQKPPQLPRDADHTIYESYVELDLDAFAPEQFRGEGLPLPYVVTIDKDSRKILEIRRNWREKDDLAQARQVFVQFPFIRGLGFYGLGFLHLLGNATLALTAAWREMLDAGMFANFPGFVADKTLMRQLTNQFRCPPGGGVGVDLPAGADIRQKMMPFPYKEMGPAFSAFITQVEQNARQTAMIANSPVAEGKQNAPVGTTLALIEQATKVVSSAFKRLHGAQATEFQILRDLFREDPEALWRHNPQSMMGWQKAQVLQALQRYELVPVADPNNPTSLHRAMKGALLKTLQSANPAIYDPIAVDRRIMDMAGIDPEGLFKPPEANAAQQAAMQQMMMMRERLQQQQLQLRQTEIQLRAAEASMKQQGQAADRASKERIAVLNAQVQRQRDQEKVLLERLQMVETAIQHLGVLSQQANEESHAAPSEKPLPWPDQGLGLAQPH